MDQFSPQQEFYSLEPQTEPQIPWWKNRRVLLMFGAGAFAMAFTVFLVIFALNFMKSATEKADHEALLERAQELMKEEAEECAADDAGCLEDAQADAAREVGEIDACDGLADGSYGNCVTLIAFDSKNPELCKALTGDERTDCEDGAYLLLAREEMDYGMCKKISDKITRLSCEGSIEQAAVLTGDCDGYGVPASFCEAGDQLKAVIASGDPAGCDRLKADERDSCRDIFNSLDEDKDGLSLADEHEYGTSPTNADTDGDGYSDGVEVQGGYDPLK